jgi:hypothetical protein
MTAYKTTVEIPINAKPYQNVDSGFTQGLGSEMYDSYLDDVGNVCSFPGTTKFTKTGTNKSGDGGYWWENKQVAVFVSDGRVFSCTDSGVITELTNSDLLTAGTPVTFTDNGDYLVMANGGKILYTDGTAGSAQFISDGDAPTEVTHVAFFDQWLIANKAGTGQFGFCDFMNSPTTWSALDVYTAEADADYIIALYVVKRVLVIIGTRSVEFWYNDGTSPFSRLEGILSARGGMSAYSQTVIDEVMYLFDNKRKLVSLAGQTATAIDTSFDRTFQNLETVSDCRLESCSILGKSFLFANFPTEDQCFIYDIGSGYWFKRTYWNKATSTRERFVGQSYIYARSWNKHLWCSRFDDTILEMNELFYTDNGNQIYFFKDSGFIDHSAPLKEKRSYRLQLFIKNGQGLGDDGNTIPQLRLRTIDMMMDGTLRYSNWRYINLNRKGQYSPMVILNSMGSYYSRKYQIEGTPAVPIVIGKVYEEVGISGF